MNAERESQSLWLYLFGKTVDGKPMRKTVWGKNFWKRGRRHMFEDTVARPLSNSWDRWFPGTVPKSEFEKTKEEVFQHLLDSVDPNELRVNRDYINDSMFPAEPFRSKESLEVKTVWGKYSNEPDVPDVPEVSLRSWEVKQRQSFGAMIHPEPGGDPNFRYFTSHPFNGQMTSMDDEIIEIPRFDDGKLPSERKNPSGKDNCCDEVDEGQTS